mgnify:FL=1
MLILPAIDIYNGKCVRLRQGNFEAQTLYSESPTQVAQSFLEDGLSHLHVVDLEGAQAGQLRNWKVILSILLLKGIHVQVGGGIRSADDARRLLDAGAARIIVGSLAIQAPTVIEEWISEFGTDRIVVAMDICDGVIAYKGWLEKAYLSPTTFINKMQTLGLKSYLCTDIRRDGMLQGPNVELYAKLRMEFPTIELIASGGVSSIDDLQRLDRVGCSGAIVGKAIYEGRVEIAELKRLSEQ